MSDLGALVLKRRKELGLTQSQLAERMTAAGHPITRGAIGQLEQGAIQIPNRVGIEAFAEALDLSAAALLAQARLAGDSEGDAQLAQLGTLYGLLDRVRRRELVLLADALLRAQRMDGDRGERAADARIVE